MNSQTRLINTNIVNEEGFHNDSNNNQSQQSQQQQQQQQMQAYNIRVPNHARPNEPFAVSVNGRTIRVQCPPNARLVFYILFLLMYI